MIEPSPEDVQRHRLVVRGSDEHGQTIALEAVHPSDDAAERLRMWSVKAMSKPFHHDVHLATEVVTTTYRRVSSLGPASAEEADHG